MTVTKGCSRNARGGRRGAQGGHLLSPVATDALLLLPPILQTASQRTVLARHARLKPPPPARAERLKMEHDDAANGQAPGALEVVLPVSRVAATRALTGCSRPAQLGEGSLLGARGGQFVAHALSTHGPAEAIEQVQQRGALRDPECEPLLGLLDQIGQSRAEARPSLVAPVAVAGLSSETPRRCTTRCLARRWRCSASASRA